MIQLEMRMITKYLKKYLIYIYIYTYIQKKDIINNIGIYTIL